MPPSKHIEVTKESERLCQDWTAEEVIIIDKLARKKFQTGRTALIKLAVAEMAERTEL